MFKGFTGFRDFRGPDREPRWSHRALWQLIGGSNIGALIIIRIGFWDPLYYDIIRNPRK